MYSTSEAVGHKLTNSFLCKFSSSSCSFALYVLTSVASVSVNVQILCSAMVLSKTEKKGTLTLIHSTTCLIMCFLLANKRKVAY